MRWPLDHIFTSEEFRLTDVNTGVDFNSDHFPTYAHFTFEPDLADEQAPVEPTEEDWKLAKDQMDDKDIESFEEIPSGIKKLRNS